LTKLVKAIVPKVDVKKENPISLNWRQWWDPCPRIASARIQQEAQTVQHLACLKRPVQRRRKKSFSEKSTGS
jgi:hypothetical protein